MSMILLDSGAPVFGQAREEYLGKKIWIAYNPSVLDQATKIIGHELGHAIYNFQDNGMHKDVFPFIGHLNGENIGATKDSSPYDLMHTGPSSGFSPFNLYALPPYNTNDLLNVHDQAFHPLYIEQDALNKSNKHNIRLKAIREKISTVELQQGINQTVILPIKTDISESNDLPYLSYDGYKFVENQRFLVEYRNGKGFDNMSAMYRDNESKGILISHIINDKSFERITDIENTEPFPDGSRNPNLAWDNDTYIGSTIIETNGKWYFGKKINDWMDDIAPNSVYTLEGGKGTWWRVPGSKNGQSLPSDFYYDEPGRNAFTPTTRPNTRSWKDNETNIAVFVDKIDGDYADLTIYRNYHSTPLTTKNAKEVIDGEKGLTIAGDGYIGENFSVGEGTRLSLGDGTAGQVTLIPNTNMLVKSTGHLMLREEGKLILENSSLNFIDGSMFSPYDDAHIELNNSGINFELGSIIDYGPYNLNFDNYYLSISGVSSFYNSSFVMIDASVLTVNENSNFTLKEGTNIVMSPLSTFTLKAGSELILEDGVNLVFMNGASVVFETGSKLTVNGNAKITGNIQIAEGASISILDVSSLIIQQCQMTIYSSLKIGANSSLIVEYSSILTCDDGAIVELAEDAEIRVMNGGKLVYCFI